MDFSESPVLSAPGRTLKRGSNGRRPNRLASESDDATVTSDGEMNEWKTPQSVFGVGRSVHDLWPLSGRQNSTLPGLDSPEDSRQTYF